MTNKIKFPCAVRYKNLTIEEMKEVCDVFVKNGAKLTEKPDENWDYFGLSYDNKTENWDTLSNFSENDIEDDVTVYTYDEIMSFDVNQTEVVSEFQYPCCVDMRELSEDQINECHEVFNSFGVETLEYPIIDSDWDYFGVDYANGTVNWTRLDSFGENTKLYSYEELMSLKKEADGWTVWDGRDDNKPKQLDGVRFEVKFRNGDIEGGNNDYPRWDHIDHDRDIVAYRIIAIESISNPTPSNGTVAEGNGSNESTESFNNKSFGYGAKVNISFTINLGDQQTTLTRDEARALYNDLCGIFEGELV